MRCLVRCLTLLPALLLCLTTSRASAAPQAPLLARIDTFVRAEMERQKVPGVGIGIVKNGKVLVAKGYGFANLEHQVPAGPDTLFQAGSLGKQFTAMAVMLQVEAGKLSLTDPVSKFFPGAPASWNGITVRHLLNHTSGIPDLEGTLDYRKDYTDEDLARFAYALQPEFAPGARWSYSNTGYVLLGIIVNRVAGTFYGNVLSEKVFKPAGMKTARIINEEDIIPHRAAGYRIVDGVLKNQEWVAPSLNTTGDGSMYVSVKDMLAWDAAVQARAILTPESWKEILSPAPLNSGATYPYGFGWQFDERAGKPLHQHTGAWQGFTSYFGRYLGEGVSIVVLTNSAAGIPSSFAEGLAPIVSPALAQPTPTPIEDREPRITARATELLEKARTGTLAPADFAYVRAGFFPDGVKRYQAHLSPLGAPGPLVLVERTTLGDDRVYSYLVTFGPKTFRFSVGLSADDRLTLFRLRPQ
ncbi:beta-lactamase family protein [Pyxidicoccus parkwayensis]|uniref:Beta-lactamase family protein n=1 Tax=Pyxidicoccus parkwayensis TaxID=2813578 RepID=A0ABX7NUA0_9BACT|nr:serine hydrolase domain-containing protein [Pyxidicoccus parkwaysis]QSQ22063.1 beta-lactamase family protein [Pyxidicoccus parkwaysis]